MAAHKIVQEPTPLTPTINDRHHTIAQACCGVRLRSFRRSTATLVTGMERLASIFLSSDSHHRIDDDSSHDGSEHYLLLRCHPAWCWRWFQAKYGISGCGIRRGFTPQPEQWFCVMMGASSRTPKHTNINKNTNHRKTGSLTSIIISIVDMFVGNTVRMGRIYNNQLSIFSGRRKFLPLLGQIYGMQQSTSEI